MKSSDLKVVAIILSIALFFTIITSNAVSIASVVILAKGGTGTQTQTVTPGTDVLESLEEAREKALEIGFPLLIVLDSFILLAHLRCLSLYVLLYWDVHHSKFSTLLLVLSSSL